MSYKAKDGSFMTVSKPCPRPGRMYAPRQHLLTKHYWTCLLDFLSHIRISKVNVSSPFLDWKYRDGEGKIVWSSSHRGKCGAGTQAHNPSSFHPSPFSLLQLGPLLAKH